MFTPRNVHCIIHDMSMLQVCNAHACAPGPRKHGTQINRGRASPQHSSTRFSREFWIFGKFADSGRTGWPTLVS